MRNRCSFHIQIERFRGESITTKTSKSRLSIVSELKKRPKISVIIILLFTPIIVLSISNTVFFYWMFGRGILMSVVAPPLMDVSATPSQPVFPGTHILLTVTNTSEYPIEGATVYVVQHNGSTLFQHVTNNTGQITFIYPGTPVAVNTVHQDFQPNTIIVGIIPVIWYIAFWLLVSGFTLFSAVIIYAWVQKQRIESRLFELEENFQELRKKSLEIKQFSDIKNQSMNLLEALSAEYNLSTDLPDELFLFLEDNEIHEYFHFGLEFARSEVTGNRSFNLNLALFSLTQAFEGILMKLAETHDEYEIRNLFSSRTHMTLGWMLQKLFPIEEFENAIKFFGSFDKKNESVDFTNKILALIDNQLIMDGWQYGETLEQPYRDFIITLLTRNFTHHSTTLDVSVYTNEDIYSLTEKHVASAILRVFTMLKSHNNG